MQTYSISFPGSKDKTSKSLAEAFVAKLGLKPNELEVVQIREGVFGVVVPNDVEDSVVLASVEFGGRVAPFNESEALGAPEIKEGTWIELIEGAAGVRFRMSGTRAADPVEGEVRAGRYFVLGIQESNGGKFATLGRVDRLEEIGKPSGPGGFTYNVDLNVLASSLAPVKVETKAAEAKKESTSEDMAINLLEFLLPNEMKSTDAEPTMEELMSLTEARPAKADDKPITEAAKSEAKEQIDESMEAELFVETRALIQELESRGYDLDNMSEAEIQDAADKLLAELDKEPEDADSKDEAKDGKDEKAEDDDEAFSPKADDKDTEPKND